MDENQKTNITCEIFHYRDGVLIAHVKPYSEASLLDKALFHLGLKNLTRSV